MALKIKPLIIASLLIATGDIFAKGKALKRIDVTPPDATENVLSLQAEDNYYDINANYTNSQTHYINATLEYATKAGYTYQAQVINCPASGGGAQSYECDVYINLSKYTKLNNWLGINTGSQNGTVFQSSAMQWHSSSYASVLINITDWFTVYGGSYWANKQLSTTTGIFGYLTGFSLIPYKDFKIEGQYMSGSNNLSGGTMNFWYKSIYIGVGGGEHNSFNEFYGSAGFRLNLTDIFNRINF